MSKLQRETEGWQILVIYLLCVCGVIYVLEKVFT